MWDLWFLRDACGTICYLFPGYRPYSMSLQTYETGWNLTFCCLCELRKVFISTANTVPLRFRKRKKLYLRTYQIQTYTFTMCTFTMYVLYMVLNDKKNSRFQLSRHCLFKKSLFSNQHTLACRAVHNALRLLGIKYWGVRCQSSTVLGFKISAV